MQVSVVEASNSQILAAFCFDGCCFKLVFKRIAGANTKTARKTLLCSDEHPSLIHHYALGYSASRLVNHKIVCSDNGTILHDHHLCTLTSYPHHAKAHVRSTSAWLAVYICTFIASHIPSAVLCLFQQPVHVKL